MLGLNSAAPPCQLRRPPSHILPGRSRSSADPSRGMCCLPQLSLPPGASLGSLLPFPADAGLSHRLGVAGHVPKFNQRSGCTRRCGTQTPGDLEIKATSGNPPCLVASLEAVASLRSHQGQADTGCVCHSRGVTCVPALSAGGLGGPFFPTGGGGGILPQDGGTWGVH